jgi:hypothetical protein
MYDSMFSDHNLVLFAQIILESLLAVVICTWGVLRKSGKPQSIHLPDLQMADYTLLCPSFRRVCNNGSSLKQKI